MSDRPRFAQPGFVLLYILVLGTVLVALVAALFGSDLADAGRIVRRQAALQAENLADAGLEHGLVQLRSNASYSGETLPIGQGTVTVTITADGLDRIITAQAVVDSGLAGTIIRVKRLVAQGDPAAAGSAFSFAIQTGSGGFATGGNKNPKIDGNIYSNGNVQLLGSGTRVTGNVTAVGTVINNGTIGGTITEGAAPQPLPDIDIAAWQARAATGATHTGDYTIADNGVRTLGAPDHIGVITGRLLISGNATINLAGPLWIKGRGGSSLEISSNPRIILDGDVAQAVIVSDGRLTFSGNARFETEDDDSDLLIYTSAPGSVDPNYQAVLVNANTRFINAALYAANGQIAIGQQASGLSITSFTAQRLFVNSNAQIEYSEGLIDARFSPAGPSGGSFVVTPGSYQSLNP